MTKYTTEMAEKQEIVQILDALGEGIELNDDFLNRRVGADVKNILMHVPQCDRLSHLSDCIDEDNCYFNGSPAGNDPGTIWIDIHSISVQFEGEAEDFFENPDDWHIDGDLAYHSVGYGLTIPVDIVQLTLNILFPLI